jgi:energy-coupling factor transport system ATP-binding protein
VAGLRAAGWQVPDRPLSERETAQALRDTPGLLERLRGAEPAGSDALAGPLDDGPPILEVRDLTFAYRDGHRALDGVSLEVRPGEFLAIAGANGAGKTTLGSLLSGVLEPPRGKVFLQGRDAGQLPAWAVAEKVGHVFQNPEHQFVADTARGELAFSLSPKDRGRPGHLSPEQERLTDEWLGRLDLLKLAEANPFSLSQGQKRRLSVAAMLIRGCPVLILDEPTLGQDAVQSSRLMDMMVDFRQAGGTVVMITHDMRIVADYASRVVVLGSGKVMFSGAPDGLFAQPDVVRAARLSLPAVAEVGLLLQGAEAPDGRFLTARGFLEAAGAADGRDAEAPAGGGRRS